MKRQPINMFAATSEDLPLFSGFALTQAAEMPVKEEPSGYIVTFEFNGKSSEIQYHTWHAAFQDAHNYYWAFPSSRLSIRKQHA